MYGSKGGWEEGNRRRKGGKKDRWKEGWEERRRIGRKEERKEEG